MSGVARRADESGVTFLLLFSTAYWTAYVLVAWSNPFSEEKGFMTRADHHNMLDIPGISHMPGSKDRANQPLPGEKEGEARDE